MSDSWQDDIAAWLDTPDCYGGDKPSSREYLTSGEILREAINIEKRHNKRADQMRVAGILLNLGYTKVQKYINGRQLKVWVKK